MEPSMRPRFILALLCLFLPACTYYRTTDPAVTADQQFLLSEATIRAVEQLSATALRDRLVYVDTTYLIGPDNNFLVAEIRARLLVSGVRLTPNLGSAKVILEL